MGRKAHDSDSIRYRAGAATGASNAIIICGRAYAYRPPGWCCQTFHGGIAGQDTNDRTDAQLRQAIGRGQVIGGQIDRESGRIGGCYRLAVAFPGHGVVRVSEAPAAAVRFNEGRQFAPGNGAIVVR